MEKYIQTPITDLELVCTDGSLYFSKHAMSLISKTFAISMSLTYEVSSINTNICKRAMTLVLDSILGNTQRGHDEEIANAFVYMYKMEMDTGRISAWIKSMKDSQDILILIASMNPDALSIDGMDKELLKIISWHYKKIPKFATNYTIFDICTTPREVYHLYKKVNCERNAAYWQCIAAKLATMIGIKSVTQRIIAHNVINGGDAINMAPLIQLVKK